MNLCNNCKYRSGYKFDFCEHPNNGIDPISGGVQPRLCAFSRSRLNGLCGPTGDLFEPLDMLPPPKLTLWGRIRAFLLGDALW